MSEHGQGFSEDSLIKSYLAAYGQANPMDPQPSVRREGDLFHVYGTSGQAFYRLDQLADVRDRLLDRAKAAQTH